MRLPLRGGPMDGHTIDYYDGASVRVSMFAVHNPAGRDLRYVVEHYEGQPVYAVWRPERREAA